MSVAADFAWHGPISEATYAAFRAAGITGVIRYVSGSGSKAEDAAEARGWHAAGFDHFFVYETAANRVDGGQAAGRADGQTAVAALRAAGAPAGTACYAATDYDAPGATPAIRGYYTAFSTALRAAGYRSGAYGGVKVVTPLGNEGIVDLCWQTAAWSHGARYTGGRAALYQRVGSPVIAGISCDLNDVLADDAGQWRSAGAPAPVPVTPTPAPAPRPVPAPKPAETQLEVVVDGSGRRTAVVHAGMTLGGLAAAVSVTLTALLGANPAITNPDHIVVGQHITLPPAAHVPATATVVPVTPAAPVVVTPAPASVTPAPAAASGGWYTVRRGDTLSAIARAHGTTWQALQAANALRNPNALKIGQVLRLPSGAAAVAPPTSHRAPAGIRTAVVRRGDTVGAIAKRNGTTTAKIKALNPAIRNINLVYPGQVLRVR